MASFCLLFLRRTAMFLLFQLRCVKNHVRRYALPAGKKNGDTLYIMGNGPSLKTDLPGIIDACRQPGNRALAVNFCATTEEFFQAKPALYCLLDGLFFTHSHSEEKVRAMYDLMNKKVDWDMELVLPSSFAKQIREFVKFDNPHIRVTLVNTLTYTGPEELAHRYYRKGYAMPAAQNIVIMAIMVGLNRGYSKIRLYGVDHTFLDGIGVDDDNHVVFRDTHFYGSQQRVLVDKDGNPYHLSIYLGLLSKTFDSHLKLMDYAQERGIEILNCTKGSMIDAYPRLKK